MQKVGNTWLPDGDRYFGPIFARGDVFEMRTLLTGLKYVRQHRTAVDGGAHVGSWSRYLAEQFDVVVGFEPNEGNYECAVANTARLGNVAMFNVALGDAKGLGGMRPGNNSGCWHLSDGDDIAIGTLDSLNLQDVDYLKLDVEGYEGRVILGALETIERCRPVVQVEEKRLPHSYVGPSARSLLEGMGYKEVDRCARDVVFTCA